MNVSLEKICIIVLSFLWYPVYISSPSHRVASSLWCKVLVSVTTTFAWTKFLWISIYSILKQHFHSLYVIQPYMHVTSNRIHTIVWSVSYSEVPKFPSRGAEHRIKISQDIPRCLRIALQNFVFLSFWPVTKMKDA